MQTVTLPRYGTMLFGEINGYPPSHWRYAGVRNGSCILERVIHGRTVHGQDQGVSRDDVARLAR
jgi:hypothetical protein